ncbi:hypothetical protein [Kordia sp.]|uniref:hypothetical protein n=1 Tax=Kordia sp. TaxID=1965332 RepID=UPI003D6B9A18
MKKKNLKSLKLNKKSVSSLTAEKAKGGFGITSGHPICSVEPEFCNWTLNRWCYNTGSPGICTAPK